MTLPLKWHGGKQKLSSWILSHAPKDYVHRVIAFAGGLGEFLQWSPDGFSEVVNDIDQELFTFWSVLRDPKLFEDLRRRAEACPLSERLWEESKDSSSDDLVGRALKLMILVRQSRQALKEDFCTLSRTRTRRAMNEQASSWLSAVEGLPEAHDRLKGVVVLNRDAMDVIRQQDGKDTWFYLDPPYMPETRVSKQAYDHEMSEDDHARLLLTLSDISGKFLLSGYDCPLYSEMAQHMGWTRVEKSVASHAGKGSKKSKRTECLWKNY